MTRPTLSSLQALAAGIALDRTLEVHAGREGCGWSIDTHTGRIQVDPTDLETLPEIEIHGLIGHEAAHAAVTRYPWLVPEAVRRAPGVALLLNALEDCRIETWMMRRLPGTLPWIEAYNDRLFPADSGELSTAPLAVQYALGAVHAWWHQSPPSGLDPRVLEALDDTAEAREAVIEMLPPIHAEVPQTARYVGSRLERVFLRHDGLTTPDAHEIAVRLSAAEAWAHIWTHILPTFRTLVALDPPEPLQKAEAAMLARMGAWVRPVRLKRPMRPDARGAEVELPAIDAALLDRMQHPPSEDDWETARRDVLPLIDTLVETLLRVLQPRSRPRWIDGFHSGQRLDLRAAMRFDARPERLDLWQRKTVPDRTDPHFLLLVDLSGSMRGDRIHWAFRGVVLLCEVLERLDLPFTVQGFQDVAIPFKDASDTLPRATAALSTMPAEVSGSRSKGRNRPQHNWDGPVLDAAATTLTSTGARTPVLIVVSDGLPSGPEQAEASLHRAVKSVGSKVHLIGVGLGPGTEHVGRFYPNAISEVALQAFPAALGRCIQSALGVG